jgi:hypothetical protein
MSLLSNIFEGEDFQLSYSTNCLLIAFEEASLRNEIETSSVKILGEDSKVTNWRLQKAIHLYLFGQHLNKGDGL